MTAELIATNEWERALYRHLVSHVDEDRDLLDDYQRVAEESDSAAFRYLVSLIGDEERRHHAMFAGLAKTLETEVERRTEAFAIPRIGHWGFDRARLLEVTERFLALEKRDATQLLALEAELEPLEPVKDTTMWQLLVRLMEADTSKHISILELLKGTRGAGKRRGQSRFDGLRGMTATETATECVASLEPLGRSEWLELLALAKVGRLGFVAGGHPEILPVNYVLDGDSVLFRTSESSVLTQASLSEVAFEVDHIDETGRSGWSVIVHGHADDIGNAIDPTSERLRQLTLITWAPGDRHRWFVIRPRSITGRRLRVLPASL